MNRRYLAINDEAFIFDENNERTKRTYKEGIDALLEQENLVEEIQSQIKKTNKEIEKLGTVSTPKQSMKSMFKLANLALVIVLCMLTVLLGKFLEVTTLFQLIKEKLFICLCGGMVVSTEFLALISGADRAVSAKYKCMEYNALNAQLEYLKEREKVEVAKLNKLKEDLANKPSATAKRPINKDLNLTQLMLLRELVGTIYDENYELPEIKGKQKTLN